MFRTLLLAFCAAISLQSTAQTLDAFNPTPNSSVYAVAVQPDGKILAAGDFSLVSGHPHQHIVRLFPNGAVDDSFVPTANNDIFTLAVQNDGRILAGGWFDTLCGQPRILVGRLNPDGSLDTSFNAGLGGYTSIPGVYSINLQSDNSILLCGGFKTVTTDGATNIAHLNADLTLDTRYALVPNDIVYTAAQLPDGKTLLSGAFTSINGLPRPHLARVNADGSLDSLFTNSVNDIVLTMAVQADGKTLLGGPFTTLNGQVHGHLARLNTDGSLDTNFTSTANNFVRSMAVQADGKILVGGQFITLNGTSHPFLGRLNSDGTTDTNFTMGAGSYLYAVQLQEDSKILVGGTFNFIGGQPKSFLARFTNTDPAADTLSTDGTSITWARAGAGPDFSYTRFDISTNGSPWLSLGVGSRIDGGWQLSGLSIDTNATIRARGYSTGGRYSASSAWTEIGLGPVSIAVQPASLTNNFNIPALFNVEASGSAPITFQWYKNGIPITNGNGLLSAQMQSLALTNVAGADQGSYFLVASNAFGAVTSSVATLTVTNDPSITLQPTSITSSGGQTVAFHATAIGSNPLNYQWRMNGMPRPGATASSLTLTNIQLANIGSYDVVVTNAYGTATSSIATLTANLAVADNFDPNADDAVLSIALQPDGKMLIGGNFTGIAGTSTPREARLNSDGTLDTTFTAVTDGAFVSWAVCPSGDILACGGFSSPGTNLVQLNLDGSTDISYDAELDTANIAMALAGPTNVVVGGPTNINSYNCNGLALLNANGTINEGFSASGSGVFCIAPQTNGNFLVAGAFTRLSGQAQTNIGRLHANGSPDETFTPYTDGPVYCVVVQPDGKILLSGLFSVVNGEPRNCLARLNADGTLDDTFAANANNFVTSMTLQTDGKITIVGEFDVVNGEIRFEIARLNPDGSLDETFFPAVGAADGNPFVTSLALQADGEIVVTGIFNSLAGQPRNNIGRLTNSSPAIASLLFDGSTIRWMRSGSSPEVWQTTFEYSVASNQWVYLGEGTRVPGGWQLPDVSLPEPSTIRARGYTGGGYYNNSTWYIENTLQVTAPQITAPTYDTNSNQLTFTITGNTGQPCVIETSTDLQTWIPIGTNTLPFALSQPINTNAAQYYRGRLQ